MVWACTTPSWLSVSFPQPHFSYWERGGHLLLRRCSGRRAPFSPLRSSLACREARVRGRGNGSFQGLFSAPPAPLCLGPKRGGLHLCVLLDEMGCPASGAEDDSLGSEPGTLGKARPASGQSPRELRGGRKAAWVVINPGGSQSPAATVRPEVEGAPHQPVTQGQPLLPYATSVPWSPSLP